MCAPFARESVVPPLGGAALLGEPRRDAGRGDRDDEREQQRPQAAPAQVTSRPPATAPASENLLGDDPAVCHAHSRPAAAATPGRA